MRRVRRAAVGVPLMALALAAASLGRAFDNAWAVTARGPDRAADAPTPVTIAHAAATARAAHDVDDPAIWVHPSEPDRSLVIGTVKVAAPDGALMVYGLDGAVRQTIAGLDRPNNVDVEYGFQLAGRPVDLVVVTERLRRSLRVFRIAGDGERLVEVASVPVLDGQEGDAGAPMGIGLYRRPADGRVFAIVAPKEGGRRDYLWQYEIEDDGTGAVRARLVRRFGTFSGREEIEAIAVDDELGYVYFADERSGIRKWHADPDSAGGGTELAHFGRAGFRGDHEGIAIYTTGNRTGYVVCTDQVQDRSEYRVYRREGAPGRPHDHQPVLKVVRGTGDSTDGIEATSRPLGARFPYGVLVAMNSAGRNFLLFPWERIARAGEPQLRLGPRRPEEAP